MAAVAGERRRRELARGDESRADGLTADGGSRDSTAATVGLDSLIEDRLGFGKQDMKH